MDHRMITSKFCFHTMKESLIGLFWNEVNFKTIVKIREKLGLRTLVSLRFLGGTTIWNEIIFTAGFFKSNFAQFWGRISNPKLCSSTEIFQEKTIFNSLAIRRRIESQNECYKKTKHAKFSEKRNTHLLCAKAYLELCQISKIILFCANS